MMVITHKHIYLKGFKKFIGISTPDESGPGSNTFEGVLQSPERQKWDLTTGCCLVEYPGRLFLFKGGGFNPLLRMQSTYSRLYLAQLGL